MAPALFLLTYPIIKLQSAKAKSIAKLSVKLQKKELPATIIILPHANVVINATTALPVSFLQVVLPKTAPAKKIEFPINCPKR